jgi:hypothetical protein
MNIATPLLCLSLALGSASAASAAETKGDRTERKTVTLINAEGKLDGGHEISREAVRECIVSLPSAESLEPEVVSDSRFLREINGDAARNAWTKVYTAKVVINYMVYKKDMLIVATRSVEGKEPTLKEVDKRLPQSREFVSNPAEGDIYAGRSNRQHYYSKPEDAVKDARQRAQVWLKQQAPLLCGDIR